VFNKKKILQQIRKNEKTKNTLGGVGIAWTVELEALNEEGLLDLNPLN